MRSNYLFAAPNGLFLFHVAFLYQGEEGLS